MGNDTLHCPRQFAENSRLYLISSSSTDLQHNARALTFAENCSTVLYQVSQIGPRCSKVFRTAPRCFYTFNQKSNACSTMARAWRIKLRETQSLSKLGFRARLKRSEVCWALVALNGLEEGICGLSSTRWNTKTWRKWWSHDLKWLVVELVVRKPNCMVTYCYFFSTHR